MGGLISGLLLFLCTLAIILFIASANVNASNKEIVLNQIHMVWYLISMITGYLFGRCSREC